MRLCAVVLVLLPGLALARPVEESTRIGAFAGVRYVPHGHIRQLAQDSGTPLTGDTPLNFEGLASFAYRPLDSLEVSLEVGYAADQLEYAGAKVGITSIPIVATARWAPLDTRLYPYLGAGGGYMLNFFSKAPSGETEHHTRTYHLLAGAAFDISPRLTVFLEDRFQIALADLVPLGELQTGGNALMVGLSFVLAPEAPVAPHADNLLR